MRSSPHSPRRQRKALYTAHSFQRRLRMSVPLSRELRKRFRIRALPVRKGDTVRVLSGSFVGREERVARVVRRDYSLVLDNVTLKTGEEKLKPLPIRPSHLVITRLNLSDPWRRRILRVSDEEVTPEERGEPAEPETPEGAAETSSPTPPVAAEPVDDQTDDDAPSPEAVPAPKKRTRKPKAGAIAEEAGDA